MGLQHCSIWLFFARYFGNFNFNVRYFILVTTWLTVFSEIRLFTVLRYCLFPLSVRYNTQKKKDGMVIIDSVTTFSEEGEGGE